MSWKEIKFRVIEREYELLEKIAKKKGLKHGVAEIFGNYSERLLKKVFNYEVSDAEKDSVMAGEQIEDTKMSWKKIKFRVIEREYKLLEKIAKKKKLKHGVAEIFGSYSDRLLKKVFNYEPSVEEQRSAMLDDEIEGTLKLFQPHLDTFYAGGIPSVFENMTDEELDRFAKLPRIPASAFTYKPFVSKKKEIKQ